MDAFGLWSFVYSINFKLGKFQPQTIIFLMKKPTVVWVKISQKKNFFRFEISLPQASKKLILPLKKYFKTLKDMIIGTASTYVFESFTFLQSWWDNVVEIGKFDATSRAYSRPILRSTIERCSFCKNYTNLYFNAKHLEKGLDRGGGVSRKCPDQGHLLIELPLILIL